MGNGQCNCFRKRFDFETTVNFPTENNTNSNFNNDYFQKEILKSPKTIISLSERTEKVIKYNNKLIIKIQSVYRMYSFKKKYEKSLKKYLIQKESLFISDILSSFNINMFNKISSLNPNKNPLEQEEKNKNLRTKLLITTFNDNPSIYIGSIDKYNNKNGNGILYTLTGQKYEGNFINNEFKGLGRLTDINQKYTSEGNFINFKLNGKGKKYEENNNNYEGDFTNNKKNGKGKEETNEYIYIGEFKNDIKEGKGKVEYKITKDKYEGDFLDNNISGEGIYYWENKHIYEGQFLNGKMHGKGKYIWPNGSYYIGYYNEGLKEGYGEIYWNNGKYYKGNFIKGKPNGIGILFDNGIKKKLLFKNGNIQGSIINQEE